jgi:hypothetical protein
VLKIESQLKKPAIQMLRLFHVCLDLRENQISIINGKIEVDSMHTRSKSLVYLFWIVLL